LVVVIAIGWWLYHRSPLPEGFVAGNGRLEAEARIVLDAHPERPIVVRVSRLCGVLS
jgi:hypothetical protein